MKQTSDEGFFWLYGIIKSCQSEFHFKAAEILIELFSTLYPESKKERITLIDLMVDKQNEVKNKVA